MAHVLIVGEEPELGAVLPDTLAGSGHHATRVRDASTALAAARARPFDLVIASVDGAGRPGFELCSALRDRGAMHACPVVLLIARAEPGALVRALECGADDVLTAPFSAPRVRACVQAALARRAGGAGAAAAAHGEDAPAAAGEHRLTRLLASLCRDLAQAREALQATQEHEARLHESEARYRQLVEGSVQGIMIVQRGDIVHCNAACARIFGHNGPEDLIGTPAIDVVHPEDRHDALRTGSAEMRAGDPRLLRYYRGVRKDGSVLWYEPSRDDIQWNGRRAVIWTINDVTESRVLRQQLESAQRMDSIGRLAGGIAHDFNNILSVITSYAEIVRNRPGLAGECRGDVDVILDAAERAAALTRQLLAFSRKQIMRMEPVDLNGVVTGMDKMLRRLIGEDVALRVDLAPDLHVVRADRSQLEQIVMNLAVNARDAMPTGGALTIESRNEYLDEQFTESHYGTKVGPHVLLAVSDTGIGMDETTRARIFEPFFTTKASSSGTGLGLSTVFGIVQQMGGSVWAYSEPGKGTSFKIHLPAHPDLPAELPPEAKADPRQMRGTETILVVEDDDRVRTATQRILEDSGYRVLPAPHGAAALEILRAEAGRIDLVLSDVVMPGMSASELLGAIRDTAQIPILFMSGYTDNSVVNHGILEGELPFIHKPFSLRSLLLKIREVLDQGDARGAGSPRLSRDPSRER